MAAFNFPPSPSNGDTYTLNSVTYQWDGTKWVRYSAAVGAQGDTGSTGAQGAQGHQGHQGLQGAQAHISTSAPSSGVNNGDLWWDSDDGDLAIYYNDGNSSQWVDINTGPRGAQGGTGPTGAQGNQGHQGAAGAQGAQGHQGAAGAQGAQGHQGATAAAGAQGNQGNQGVSGSDGSDGTAGAQGAQGHQGHQGAGGTAGAQGSQGHQGHQGAGGTAGAQGNQGHQGAGGSATISSNANNRIITGGSGTNLVGEQYFTYTHTGSASQLNIKRSTSTDQEAIIYYDSSNLDIETREGTGIRLKCNKNDRITIDGSTGHVVIDEGLGVGGVDPGGSTLLVNGNLNLSAGGNTSWQKVSLNGSNYSNGDTLSINNWGDAEGDYWGLMVNQTMNQSGNYSKTNSGKRTSFITLDGRMGRVYLGGSSTSGNPTESFYTDWTGNIFYNSGYGSNGQVFGCRAWCQSDGSTGRNGSGNITSVDDNGTGDYTYNFATSMPDNDFSATVTCYQGYNTIETSWMVRSFSADHVRVRRGYVYTSPGSNDGVTFLTVHR